MEQRREYTVRSTHHCMVRIHGEYHTIVYIGWFGPSGEYQSPDGPEAPYLWQCLGPNGLFAGDGADTVEGAFRAGWDAIVAHMDMAQG